MYHEVVLTNLKPNTKYYIRITSLPDPKQWRKPSYLLTPEIEVVTSGQTGADDDKILNHELFKNFKKDRF